MQEFYEKTIDLAMPDELEGRSQEDKVPNSDDTVEVRVSLKRL